MFTHRGAVAGPNGRIVAAVLANAAMTTERAECSTATVADGFLVEDVEAWAADGTLRAHSRPLALARGGGP